MADDITLTIRVRDMSRGELTRANANINRLRTNMVNAGNSSNQTSRNFNALSNDVTRLNSRFRNLLRGTNVTQQSLQNLSRDANLVSRGLRSAMRQGDLTRSRFRAMSRDVDLLRARLTLIGNTGNFFTRLGARVLLLGDRFLRANNQAGFLRRTLGRFGDWGARNMSRGLVALGALSTMFTRIGTKLASVSRGVWIFIAVLALVGPAAQALGALLTVALGGAFIALGAYALKGNAQVKSAFSQMKNTVTNVVQQAAAPLVGPLVTAMNKVTTGASKIEPALQGAFSAAAPLVKDFVSAFGDFGTKILPGITTALENTQKSMGGFRSFMGSLGSGLGSMFKNITTGNTTELSRAWAGLGEEIGNSLSVLGSFISDMLRSGAVTLSMIAIFRTFNGILHVISGAFQIVDAATFGLLKDLSNYITNFKNVPKAVSDATDYTGQTVKDLKADLKEVNAEIAKRDKNAANISGPAKDYARNAGGGQSYNQLLAKRKDLLKALMTAEADNAGAVDKEVSSYKDLFTAIENLANQNRSYLDAESAQQKAINDASSKLKAGSKNYKSYHNALKMVHGQLDLTTTAAQNAYEQLSNIASTTQEATDKAIAANAPWEEVRKNWKEGYDSIVKLGDGMGLTKKQAEQLATKILGIPPTKEMTFKARTQSAIDGLNNVITAMQAAPNAKTITVKALSSDAIKLLKDLGFEVTQLPDGEFTVTAKTGTAKNNVDKVQKARDALKGKSISVSAKDRSSGVIGAIKRAVEALHGKSITITTHKKTILDTVVSNPSSIADALEKQAQNVKNQGHATGGYIDGPGTKTSDSIVARLSRGEYVMKASAVDKYGTHFMERLNEGRVRLPGFASGGSVSKAEKSARSEASSALSISYFGKIAGYKNDSFRKQLALPDALSDLVSSLNSWRSTIKKATHGGLENSLLKHLTKAGKSLIKYDKQLTTVNKSLDSAKTKLNDLKSAASSLSDSVKSGVMSATNITSAASDDSNVTLSDVMSTMSSNVSKASAFSDALAQLKKRGVSGTIIQQIAEAGIDGGGLQTAGALLSASDSDIASLNTMQHQINAAAKSSGKTAADAMYGAGIKAAEGLVNGLTKKKKAIEKAMMNIAKSMEKAIKKALGIHSPSRVMMKVGDHTAEGFALGMKNNRSVDTAWTSMLNTKSTGSGSSSYSTGGSGGQVIQVHIGNKMIDEIVLDSNRRTVRTRGGNVQAVFGRK